MDAAARRQTRRWSRRAAAAALLVVLGCAAATPPPPPPPEVSAEPIPVLPAPPPPAPAGPSIEARIAEAKGWSWLVERLVADGLERGRAERSFADPRVPPFEGLFFSTSPREPRSLYGAVLRPRSVAQARACAAEYAHAFHAAERATGVPAEVVVAILHVETRCGRNTGQSSVLYGLARLAMANEPGNLAANLARRAERGEPVDGELAARVRERAAQLDEMFYPEVRAVFALADAQGVDPLEIRGSGSGAFGAPQFLPTSYLRFGSDGNGDGRVDLYDIDDAAASAAHYLASYGWRGELSAAERRQVVWHYNRSDAYIDAVLGLAARLRGSVRSYYAQTPGDGVPVEAAQ